MSGSRKPLATTDILLQILWVHEINLIENNLQNLELLCNKKKPYAIYKYMHCYLFHDIRL